jgi:hypothetical protein
MIANLDIYRAAKLAIDQYGADASIQASMRADALLDEGDIKAPRSGGRLSERSRSGSAGRVRR